MHDIERQVLDGIVEGRSTRSIAEALFISARTVDRDWSMARAWLRRELSAMPRDAEAASPGGTP